MSSEEETGGAVDWLTEGKTSGHKFVNKRVAVRHNDELAKGTITMWVPGNDEADDEPALFHVKHDDGDSEDLEEGEAEEAIELGKEVELSAKKHGKRKAMQPTADEADVELSDKQRAKQPTVQQPVAEGDADEVTITGASGDVALADFPHSREHCILFKMADGAAQHCPNCYCYVCDNPASACDEWASHCHAVHTSDAWLKLRRERREAATRPPTSSEGQGGAVMVREAWSGDRLLEAVTQVFPREEAEPAGLARGIQLRPYQRQSLAFMCDVERSLDTSLLGSSNQRGGWLCDEVGMGKTAVAISLVLANPCTAPRPADGHVERGQPAP